MERVTPLQARITGLTAALTRPDPAMPGASDEAAAEAVVQADPVSMLAQERERVLAQARREGHAEGLAQAEEVLAGERARVQREVQLAHQEQADRLEEAQAALAQLVRQLQAHFASAEAQSREVVVEVAYAALLRVLGEREARASGDLLAGICAQLLDEHRLRPAVLRVGPDDVAIVSAAVAGDGELRVLADPTLRPGECRLETRKGSYDTRIEDRLGAIRNALLTGLAGVDGA